MKTIAILIPTYKRFNDLVNTLAKTEIDVRSKFIIVANLEDDELAYITNKFGAKSIIVDERKYGKLGGSGAYNLAFKIAKEHDFDYAILYADDVIPFKSNWLDRVQKEFISKNGRFGIFSSDECHFGYFGWNLVLDCPIAHFFIIDCNLVEQLFLDEYKQYVIDFEIAVRLKEQGVDIQLLPIKFKHLRSGLHRDFMNSNYNEDVEIFISAYPKYESSLRNSKNCFFVKHANKSKFISEISVNELPLWSELQPKRQLINKVRRKMKTALWRLLNK